MVALETYQERTGNVPQALQDKPDDPTAAASFYLNAFDFLSSFRGSNGFSMNPISYADIAHYARQIGYTDPSDFFPLAEVVGRLDRVYLIHQSEKSSKK